MAIDSKNNKIFISLQIHNVCTVSQDVEGFDNFWNLADNKQLNHLNSLFCNEIKYSNDYSFLGISSFLHWLSNPRRHHIDSIRLDLSDITKGLLINLYNYNEEFEPDYGSFEYDEYRTFFNLNFSYDNKYFAAEKPKDSTYIWKTKDGTLKYIFPVTPYDIKFSRNNKFLITESNFTNDRHLYFYYADNGTLLDSMTLNSISHVGKMAIPPDSSSIIIAGTDGYLRLFKPNIFQKKLVAVFDAVKKIAHTGDLINFTDFSFSNPSIWFWDFGDGETSNEQNPIHIYKDTGTYTVRLIVGNGSIFDTVTKTNLIIVKPLLKAAIETNIKSGYAPLSVQFFDISNGNVNSWLWNFGDGNTSNIQNPSNTYQKAGDYSVSLIISDSYFYDTLNLSNFIHVDISLNSINNNRDLSPTLTVYPNPANDNIKFNYTLTNPANVKIKIFNELGEIIENIDEYYQDAGEHNLILNTERYMQGVYFIKIEYNNLIEVSKFMLIK